MMAINTYWSLLTYSLVSLNAKLSKVKKGVDIIKALQVILEGCRKPKTIRTDRGMEFRSREVNKYLKIYPITVDSYAALFNCTPVDRASDSMMAPT